MADPSITELLNSVDRSSETRLVSVVDDVLAKLVANGQARTMRIPPKLVGVHPKNRNGCGVSAVEVHALGREIVKMEFSMIATRNAVCIEDDESKSIARFTHDLQVRTSGLGVVDIDMIKYGSLSNSHTNQFLAAIDLEVESDEDRLTIAGRMAPAKFPKDEKLQDAIDNGLTWLVLSSQVAKLYPSIPDLVQWARNATGAAQRNESVIELLAKIQAMVEQQCRASDGILDFSKIGEVVEQRTSLDKKEIQVYLRFVQLYGGGAEGRFIEELDKFRKVYVPTGRAVPLGTFSALTDLKLSPTEACPFFVIAVVKAQSSCPPKSVQNNMCRFILNADISSLSGPKKEAMLKAEVILRECRSMIADRVAENEKGVSKALGRLDTMMVRTLFKKESQFDSIDAVVANFVAEINAALVAASPSTALLQSPWSASSSKLASESARSSTSNLMQYSADGIAVGALQRALRSSGFVENSHVKDENDNLYRIIKIESSGKVEIAKVDNRGALGLKTKVGYDDFVQKYTLTSAKIEIVQNWEQKHISKSTSYLEALSKSYVRLALRSLAEDIGEPKLRVQLKPHKGVFVDSNFATGKLVLVPETSRFLFLSTSSDAPNVALKIDSPLDVGDKNMFLMPTFNPKDAVVPAWALQVVDDEPDATMTVSTKSVSVAIVVGAKKAGEKLDLAVPILVNRKALKAQDELTIFRAAAGKKRGGVGLASSLKAPKLA